jgi:prophage regulatory protein
MVETEAKVGLKETQIRQKVLEGTFPKPVKLSASGRAIGFIEDEIDAYIDERIAERERGYVPSASELARIEASREGRRKKREARAAEQAATARKPRGRKHVETAA